MMLGSRDSNVPVTRHLASYRAFPHRWFAKIRAYTCTTTGTPALTRLDVDFVCSHILKTESNFLHFLMILTATAIEVRKSFNIKRLQSFEDGVGNREVPVCSPKSRIKIKLHRQFTYSQKSCSGPESRNGTCPKKKERNCNRKKRNMSTKSIRKTPCPESGNRAIPWKKKGTCQKGKRINSKKEKDYVEVEEASGTTRKWKRNIKEMET